MAASISGEPEQLTVALVDTAPAMVGSMREYAELVEEALSTCPDAEQLRVVRVSLALPSRLAQRLPVRVRWWANILYVAWAARRLRHVGADVFHILDGSSAYVVRACGGRPTVVTVHDMIPHLTQRGRFGRRRASAPGRFVLQRLVRGLEEADRLIAVSACTARDVEAIMRDSAPRVDVAPPAQTRIARLLLRRSPVDWLARRSEYPFILHVGHDGFYKNRAGAVRVFARVAECSDADLVMVGPEPGRPLRRLVAAHGLHERVRIVVDPTNEDLAELYRGACLLLFPSIYEGFGLPVLEAMAAGCPVVCSHAGALPETAGGAALMAPPHDEQRLAREVLRVLDAPEEALRLIARGRERAATFTAQDTAATLLGSYARAVGAGPVSHEL